jgi:AhpD family alkylhydroperoxidase
MTSRSFRSLRIEEAHAAARPVLEQNEKKFGFVPSPLSRMALAPAVLEAALQGLEVFERSSLAPLEREVLAMTLARRNGCEYCRTLHRRLLAMLDAPKETIAALEAGTPLPSPRLETLRRFVHEVMNRTGDPSPAVWSEFLAAGFEPGQALEIVQGIAAYTLTTFANRLTESPLD